MNNVDGRWWLGGLVGLIASLALALMLSQTPLVEEIAGVLGLVALGVGLVALLLVLAAVWPGFTTRTRANLESAPVKTFMIGLVNYVFLGAIALVMMNLGPGVVIGVALLGLLLLGTFLGLPAAASLVGARLHSLREGETTRWGEIVGGSVALYLAALVPFAGWFLLLPALCLWSFGAAALTLTSRRRAEMVDPIE